MALSRKVDEGFGHIKLAEKSLKTSLLKWRPDYEIAADEYSKAATCFRTAKSYEQCKDCLMKAVECYKQNRSLFSAAKCIDLAILVCKDMGHFHEIPQLSERACNMYQHHGSPDTAVQSLDKAAKLLESEHPEQALRLYQKACDVVMLEDRPRQGAEFIGKVARIMVKLRMYDHAADAIRREIGYWQQADYLPAIGRLTVALVLVQLARGDYVAAEKAFKEWGNCCEAPEVQTLEMLLQGFDEEDADTAREALNSPFVKNMDVEYAKLARDLPLPRGIAQPQKASVRENAAPSYVSPHAQGGKSEESNKDAAGGDAEEEDDDFEGGLC